LGGLFLLIELVFISINKKGIAIKGLAYYLDGSYTYPVAIVIKEMKRK
jgi:hypothetical protein